MVRGSYVSSSPLLSIDVGTGALTTRQPRSVRRRRADIQEVGEKGQQHSRQSKRRTKSDNLKQETVDHATSEHLRSCLGKVLVRTIHVSWQVLCGSFTFQPINRTFILPGIVAVTVPYALNS